MLRTSGWSVLAVLLSGCVHRAPAATGKSSGPGLPDQLNVGAADLGSLLPLAGDRPKRLDVRPEDVLVPVGRWVTAGTVAAFTYVDPEAGLSVAADVPVPASLAGQLSIDPSSEPTLHLIMRLGWRGAAMRELTPVEIATNGLPAAPEWLSSYGPQPTPGTLWGEWRLDPRLADRFLPDYPDDLEVLFDDVPSSRQGFEVMWVRVAGCESDRCHGRVLNAPFHLRSVKLGEDIWFSLTTAAPGCYLLREGAAGPLVPVQH